MTVQELKNQITAELAAPVNSIQKIINILFLIIDFFTASSTDDIIPEWTATQTFQTDGSDDGKYCKYEDDDGNARIFETKTDDNINHEPPTDPDVTENDYWKELSPAVGSSIKEWQAGVFGAGLIIVYHNHSIYGSNLYKLKEATRPFNSTDIEAEILEGKWATLPEITPEDLEPDNYDDWDIATNYYLDDKVTKNAKIYRAISGTEEAPNVGNDPELDDPEAPVYWEEVSSSEPFDPFKAEGLYASFTNITGLKAVPTVDLTVGTHILFRDSGTTGGPLRTYRLTGSTAAETSPDIIRPNDFHATTNPKVWLLAGGVAIGKQDLSIPASAMWPTASNGCAALSRTAIATSLVNIQTLDFDQTTQEFAQFMVPLPRNWNRGNIKLRAYWTAASGSGNVVWGFKAGAYGNDDALSSALSAEVTISDALITANDLHITDFTADLAVAGSPADADLVVIQVSRNPSDGADTLTADAKLLAVMIELTTDAAVSA